VIVIQEKYTCLCCGYKTLQSDKGFWICDICGWEDDWDCWENPKWNHGPNSPYTLYQAQRNFMVYEASTPWRSGMWRKPTIDDEIDKDWEPFQKTYWY
jgi:hypothetical protein